MASRKDTKGKKLRKGEYQRKNGTYEAKLTISGIRHSLSAKTLDELRSKEEMLLHAHKNGLKLDKRSLTVNDLMNDWYSNKRGVKETTKINYESIYRRYIKPNLGSLRANDVDYSAIKSFYNGLADDGYKLATIELAGAVLSQIFDYGVRNRYLMMNPTIHAMKELFREPSLQGRKVISLTKEQQSRLEDYLYDNSCKYHHLYSLVFFLLHTGIRIGEALALKHSDISIENRLIHIRHTLKYDYTHDKNNHLNSPKTESSDRYIPMSDEVYKAYMMEKEYQRANNITCKETVDGYSDFIFINGEGKLLKVSNFNHALKIIIKQCNNDSTDVILPCFSAHSFRHTLSTRLNENNVNLSVIKRILGHFSSDITIKTYIDVDDEFVRSEYLRSESNYFKYKASINAKS